ncbi:MAG: alanine racemase [Coriobacteriales bacterium]|nr:alanine racemase [Coriobacteriales bacterium]
MVRGLRCPEDRWAWVEINLDALRQNTAALKRLMDRDTLMMCVVKADAYGHGAVRCAKAMLRAGADQFAVATVAEGVELREAGIRQPIAILSEPPVETVQTIVDHDLSPAVFNQSFALALGECAAAAGKVATYHLAIDTGMTRIGVNWRDALELRRSIDFHRGIECAGTFTHFATADVPRDWDFEMQARRFFDAVDNIDAAGLSTGLVHCANTPATMMHPRVHMDMCRAGIGLYGLYPSAETRKVANLSPVMSVRGRITRVERPEVGTGVSYGLTYRVPRPNIQICTVPIGYADGLSRVLSGNMDVLVNGERCRQVGRICMDQFMFEVSVNNVRAYRPTRAVEYGDVVTILGSDGSETILADDMAARRNTINYEVVCDFGLRLQKIYV